MNNTQNPFTHTYGSAGQAYIDMQWAQKAIKNFDYDNPSEYVYKIVGVRGGGKTVVLSDIMKYYRQQDNVDKGWIVYDLSSARDPLHTLVSYLSKEKFAHLKNKSVDISAGANIGPISGRIESVRNNKDMYYDDEVELDSLLEKGFEKHKRFLICIDDIAKTNEMVAFCSVYAKYIRAEKPVYLVCTGLFNNMEALGRVRNLTFFRRAETIEIRALSEISITMKYKKLLGIDQDEARKLTKLTRGYAYAYQVLGSLYFSKKDSDSVEDLMIDYDERLFSQSYEKIWEELKNEERVLIRIMLEHKKRAEILEHMENPGNYSVYRNSLIKSGLIRESQRGMIEFTLPHFEEYVKEFCVDSM